MRGARRMHGFAAGLLTVLVLVLGALPNAAAGSVAPTRSVIHQAVAASGANTAAGTFRPVPPARILDTRIGLGASRAVVASHATIVLQVAGRGGVPSSGVRGVIMNITATDVAGNGYVTVAPWTPDHSSVSTLNITAHHTAANLVVSHLDNGGSVSLFNGSSGPLDLIADVQGYYLLGSGAFLGTVGTVSPSRILDTRTGVGTRAMAVPARGTVTFSVVYRAGVPSGGVSAVALNVTSTGGRQAGYVTAFPAGSTRPNASILNHSAGQTKAALTMVQVGAGGMVSLYNGSSAPVHLLADIEGYVRTGIDPAAGSYVARAPQRVLDTRTSIGGHIGALAAGETTTVAIPSTSSLPAGTAAVMATITVTGATGGGHLTLFPAGYDEPVVSNLNFTSGETVANLAVVPVDGAGRLRIHNASSSTVHVVLDVSGVFGRPLLDLDPATTADPGHDVTATSCATPTFCVATDFQGASIVFDGSSWTTPDAVGAGDALTSVSCVSPTFCLAVASTNHAYRYTAPGFTPTVDPPTGVGFTSVSCVSRTWCLAGTVHGEATVYDGVSWSPRVLVGGHPAALAVSCPDQNWCLAVNAGGESFTYNGTAWARADDAIAGEQLSTVSCPVVGRCVTAGHDGHAAVYTDGTWSTPVAFGVEFATVSCATVSFCLAVDSDQAMTIYDGATWSALMGTGMPHGWSASCPTPDFCAVVASVGGVVRLGRA